MKIAIVGAGNVGGALAKQWGKKGHTILIGAKSPHSQQYQNLARDIGAMASVETVADAVRAADVVVLAIPWGAVEDAITQCGSLVGKIVIDCTNPLKPDFSGLAVGLSTSGAETIQRLASGAQVWKAFNTVGANIMANPVIEGRKAAMYYCGEGQTAKETVRGLIQDVGFEPIDLGPLASARYLEPMAMVWILSAMKYGLGREQALGLLRKT
jgi:predicted dinucleotide-binding enzyme